MSATVGNQEHDKDSDFDDFQELINSISNARREAVNEDDDACVLDEEQVGALRAK